MLQIVALAIALAFFPDTHASAQTCNPVIDGTYCASEGALRPSWTAPSRNTFAPMRGIANDLTFGSQQPATLGAATFRGGERCIGLLRRTACN
jgi:hypothetical protein